MPTRRGFRHTAVGERRPLKRTASSKPKGTAGQHSSDTLKRTASSRRGAREPAWRQAAASLAHGLRVRRAQRDELFERQAFAAAARIDAGGLEDDGQLLHHPVTALAT